MSGCQENHSEEKQTHHDHRVGMVGETDRKAMISGIRQTLSSRNFGAMVLGHGIRSGRPMKTHEGLKEGSGWRRGAFQVEGTARAKTPALRRNRKGKNVKERRTFPLACLLYFPFPGHLPPCVLRSLFLF